MEAEVNNKPCKNFMTLKKISIIAVFLSTFLCTAGYAKDLPNFIFISLKGVRMLVYRAHSRRPHIQDTEALAEYSDLSVPWVVLRKLQRIILWISLRIPFVSNMYLIQLKRDRG